MSSTCLNSGSSQRFQSSDNKLSDYVSKGNRSTDERPLTIDVLSKSIFSCFLFTQPADDKIGYSGEGEHRFRREAERHSGAKVNSSRSEATLTR